MNKPRQVKTLLTYQTIIEVDHREDMPFHQVEKLANQIRFSTSETSGCGNYGCYSAKQITNKQEQK
jgi:hypothetical protein